MRDMTDSMNAKGGEGSVNGFTSAGTPESSCDRKQERFRKLGLVGVLSAEGSAEGLEMKERGGTQPGGFLERNNTGDRN